jgi:hypothetical protein
VTGHRLGVDAQAAIDRGDLRVLAFHEIGDLLDQGGFTGFHAGHVGAHVFQRLEYLFRVP